MRTSSLMTLFYIFVLANVALVQARTVCCGWYHYGSLFGYLDEEVCRSKDGATVDDKYCSNSRSFSQDCWGADSPFLSSF